MCNVKPLAELEVNYVKCYLERISSSVEVWEMKHGVMREMETFCVEIERMFRIIFENTSFHHHWIHTHEIRVSFS